MTDGLTIKNLTLYSRMGQKPLSEPHPLPGSKSTTKDPSRIILNVGSVILILKNLKNIWKSVGGLGMRGEV